MVATVRVPKPLNLAELPAHFADLPEVRSAAAFLDGWRPLFDRMVLDRSAILMRIMAQPDGPAATQMRQDLARVDAAIQNGARLACIAMAEIVAKAPGGGLPLDLITLAEPPPSRAADGAALN